MLKKAKNIIEKRFLLITGKSEIDRHRFISELITMVNFQTFRFPKGIKNWNEFDEFIIKNKLETSPELNFEWYYLWQKGSLIILEELDEMNKQEKLSLLRAYIQYADNRKKGSELIHLIISQETENGLLEILSEKLYNVREDETRTNLQIVKQNLKVLDLEN